MKKLILHLTFLLILTVSVQAIVFQEVTSFNRNNVEYVFHPGVEFDSFDFSKTGLTINDNDKFVFVFEGGTIKIDFYEWSENSNMLGLTSNIPQKLTYKITVDNSKNYFTNGSSFILDDIYLTDKQANYSYKLFETSTEVDNTANIINIKWINKKSFIFEVQVEDEDKLIFLTNGQSILVSLTFLVLLFIIYKISKPRMNK